MTFVTPPRLSLLRTRTKAAHASMEKVPILGRLLAPDLTTEEYVSVLDSMHAFHRAFEPEIAATLAGVPQAASVLAVSRLPDLLADLAWFGVSPSPVPPPIPRLNAPAEALGALYVIEGSILGGRVIARHVADSLGVRSGEGCSYYGGRTADQARDRWQLLCDLLEGYGERDGGASSSLLPIDEAMAEAACGTFDSLDRWMRRIGVVQGVRPLAEAAAS
jgi:heme oxygenase